MAHDPFPFLTCPCSKRDYDGAVQQYVKTIGLLEPSYVIRKVRASATALRAIHVDHRPTLPFSTYSFWMRSGSGT
jgi:hypothetical protein